MNERKVFVYGTLKSGYGNNHILTDNNSILVESLYMVDGFSLYKFMKIPFAVKSDSVSFVTGEVWIINEHTEHLIDILEGVDSGVYLKHYISENFFMYIATPKKSEILREKFKPINSGVYL